MKYYGVRFGSGDPRTYTGLAPTFLYFVNMATNATIAPPTITEMFANTGIYTFSYGTTTPMAFLIDAATTTPGSNGRYVNGQLDPADRADEYSTTLIAIGTTNFALGTTSVAIGTSLTARGNTLLGYATLTYGYALDGWALGSQNLDQGSTIKAISVTILAAVNGLSGYVSNLIGSTSSSFGTSAVEPVDLFGYLKRIQENLEGNSTYSKTTGAFSILSRGSSYTLASKTITNSVSLVTKT